VTDRDAALRTTGTAMLRDGERQWLDGIRRAAPYMDHATRFLFYELVTDALGGAPEPMPGDAQRRCWTLYVHPDGNGQCRLYNGHPGDHDFVSPPAAPGLREHDVEAMVAALTDIADWDAHSEGCTVIDSLTGRVTDQDCSCGWVEIADHAREALGLPAVGYPKHAAALAVTPGEPE